MHRLFVAIVPPRAIRERLLSLCMGVSGARWQDDAQLHLTIRYIGEVDRHRAADAAAAIGGLTAPAAAVVLRGAGQFGRPGRPHSLWIGAGPREPIAALKRAADAALARVGFAPDTRAFVPHVTLARLPASAGPVDAWLAGADGVRCDPFTPDHLILFESRPGHGGSTYDAVLRQPLGRACDNMPLC